MLVNVHQWKVQESKEVEFFSNILPAKGWLKQSLLHEKPCTKLQSRTRKPWKIRKIAWIIWLREIKIKLKSCIKDYDKIAKLHESHRETSEKMQSCRRIYYKAEMLHGKLETNPQSWIRNKENAKNLLKGCKVAWKMNTNPQRQMRNKEKVAKLQKKSVQSCKVAGKMETNPQSWLRILKKLQCVSKIYYKTAQLQKKFVQSCKVAKLQK